MSSKEYVLSTLRQAGKAAAEAIQARAAGMTGAELYAEQLYIPDFDPARQYLNFPAGFVCRAPSGRMVRLVQPYDSAIYPGEPETLPAQWGFVWSQNPRDALPFIALATSPYMAGDCCTEGGVVYRSLTDNNVFPPSEYPQGWTEVE